MSDSIGVNRAFWDSLSSSLPSTTPWGVIGDFNAILSPSEKISRFRFNSTSSSDFHRFLSTSGLMDIGYQGTSFTWSNNSQGRRVVSARLDMMLLNQAWLDAFRDPTLSHLTRHTSDHNPILLSHRPVTKKGGRFKFGMMWLSHPTFRDMVTGVWNMRVDGNPQFILFHKLRSLRKILKQWNTFGHLSKNI